MKLIERPMIDNTPHLPRFSLSLFTCAHPEWPVLNPQPFTRSCMFMHGPLGAPGLLMQCSLSPLRFRSHSSSAWSDGESSESCEHWIKSRDGECMGGCTTAGRKQRSFKLHSVLILFTVFLCPVLHLSWLLWITVLLVIIHFYASLHFWKGHFFIFFFFFFF